MVRPHRNVSCPLGQNWTLGRPLAGFVLRSHRDFLCALGGRYLAPANPLRDPLSTPRVKIIKVHDHVHKVHAVVRPEAALDWAGGGHRQLWEL